MQRLLDILITADINGTLTPERGAHCIVGEVIFQAVGFRVGSESWLPIFEAHRMGIPVCSGLKDLEKIISESLEAIGISIDDLIQLDEIRSAIPTENIVESAIEMVSNWKQVQHFYV